MMKLFLYSFKKSYVPQVFFVVFLLLFTSCYNHNYYPCLKPEGKAIEEQRITSSFSKVDLALHGNVFISRGDKNEVKLEAAENILEVINTTIENNSLTISNEQCLRTKKDDIKIHITMKGIDELKISGSGSIYIEDTVKTNEIKLFIIGSGNVNIKNIDNEKIFSNISGSGNINIDGETNKHIVNISGSGNLNSFELLSDIAEMNVSGSGNCHTTVNDKLEANISGSGNVFYKGKPKISSSITGSGNVKHAE